MGPLIFSRILSPEAPSGLQGKEQSKISTAGSRRRKSNHFEIYPEHIVLLNKALPTRNIILPKPNKKEKRKHPNQALSTLQFP